MDDVVGDLFVTENKAYARCASIKVTNVPELI